MITIPTEKTRIVTDFSKYKFLIYGQPKVGKSTFTSQFDDVIFCATEAGHSFLEVFKVDIKSWEDFKDFTTKISTQNHKYKMIAIDTVDNLVKMCMDYVCKKNGIQHTNDLPYGKGAYLFDMEFSTPINFLTNCGFGFVFISHAKEREMSTKTAKWSYMDTSMPPKTSAYICGLVDFIFYCYVTEDKKRMVKTQAEKYINAGGRAHGWPSPMEMNFGEVKRLHGEYLKSKQNNLKEEPKIELVKAKGEK